jgi:adenylylsulfate kinase
MTTEPSPFAVLITGTIGSGKTSVATAIGELLGKKGTPAAVVDLDWLGWVHLAPVRSPTPDELIVTNLAAIVPNFIDAGVRHFVLARSLTSDRQLDSLRAALPGGNLIVVRLTASVETVSARLRARDEGETLEEHLAQAQEFAVAQERGLVTDIQVSTDSRSIGAVAADVLGRLGWTE